MRKNKRWPENCVWPEPVWDGIGVAWEEDDVDPMLLDEDGRELLEIKEYFDTLVEEGRLNEDYSLNEDYEEFDDDDTSEDSDDWDEPEEFVPEKCEDYWDDGFNIQAWEEDFSDHVGLLKIVPIGFEKDPIIFVRGVIGYDFVNESNWFSFTRFLEYVKSNDKNIYSLDAAMEAFQAADEQGDTSNVELLFEEYQSTIDGYR
jgi:ribonuclease-3